MSRTTSGEVWEAATVASLPARLRYLARAMRTGLRADFDVVMGTTYVVHPLAWLVGLIRRKPVVFWYADVLIGTWLKGGFGRVEGLLGEVAERVILRLPVARYIAISDSTAAKLVARGVCPDRVTVIPCGIDPDTIAAVVPEKTERRRLTVVGRLVPYKRVDVVVRAVARLRSAVPDLELVVIGQGPELDRLRALAAELGVDDIVECRGFVESHADVLAAVAASQAFVSASEIEGFGIVVVEAMALGVPYAISDIPAFREVTVGGRGGALFPAGDDEALAEVLRPLLDGGAGRADLVAEGRDAACLLPMGRDRDPYRTPARSHGRGGRGRCQRRCGRCATLPTQSVERGAASGQRRRSRRVACPAA